MPGAYAHITLVNHLCRSNQLAKIIGMPNSAKKIVMRNLKYCEMGAVSPDYPYLAIGDSGAAEWADLMHYQRTGETIHAGVAYLRSLPVAAREKGLAWLLGFAAHVTMDVTIHPVVELKVGPYHGNEKAHRVCEMNQDSYIFARLNLGGIGLSEHLNSGISSCTQGNQLHSEIEQLWRAMLKTTHASHFATNTPDINLWHSRFRLMVGKIAEEGNRLMPIARHVAVNCGLTYPKPSEIDRTYIDALAVPGGQHNTYNELFDKALEKASDVWRDIAQGVMEGSDEYLAAIGNWNLDSGRDTNGNLVFWG